MATGGEDDLSQQCVQWLSFDLKIMKLVSYQFNIVCVMQIFKCS